MKKNLYLLLILGLFSFAPSSNSIFAQTSVEYLKSGKETLIWLGIDFSHVKLIGEFSQFNGAGDKNSRQIRDIYFPAWNQIVLAEPEKYDIRGMLRKNEVFYDIDYILGLNADTELSEMESYNAPKYTKEDIQGFIKTYKPGKEEGVGVAFLVECLNKNAGEAVIHFVMMDLKTKNLILHERLIAEPRGFGIRNYWAGAIYKVIQDITSKYYKRWLKG